MPSNGHASIDHRSAEAAERHGQRRLEMALLAERTADEIADRLRRDPDLWDHLARRMMDHPRVRRMLPWLIAKGVLAAMLVVLAVALLIGGVAYNLASQDWSSNEDAASVRARSDAVRQIKRDAVRQINRGAEANP